MADYFDENYIQDEKEKLLERLKHADENDKLMVDECLLSELWPASEKEIEKYPNIKFSYDSIQLWCSEEGVEGWKPVTTDRTKSEHHNDSPGGKFFRPMAFIYSKKAKL